MPAVGTDRMRNGLLTSRSGKQRLKQTTIGAAWTSKTLIGEIRLTNPRQCGTGQSCPHQRAG